MGVRPCAGEEIEGEVSPTCRFLLGGEKGSKYGAGGSPSEGT